MMKYKIGEIMAAVEQLAPPQLAAPWDNPGLLVGDPGAGCRRVMLALDLSLAVVSQAVVEDCQLILTHHPFIFSPLKQVRAGSYEGDLILALAQHGLAAAAAHTNWDNAAGGINYALAEALGLLEVEAISDPNYSAAEILLLAGNLPEALAADELLELVRSRLGLAAVRAAGVAPGALYRRLAVVGGAGADLWQEAAQAGCDVLVSAEGKHHMGLQAAHRDFCIIDAGHFGTEIGGIHRLGRLLGERLPGLEICLAVEEDCWGFYGKQGVKM